MDSFEGLDSFDGFNCLKEWNSAKGVLSFRHFLWAITCVLAIKVTIGSQNRVPSAQVA